MNYEYLGIPLTHQKIVPANTATSLSKYCYTYQRFRLDFDDGDVELTVKSWIVGATSGAVAKIVEVHPDSGTWTNNTGYLILDSWNGTAFQDNEEIKQAAQATAANVNGLIKPWMQDYDNKGKTAKVALVYVYANTALADVSGATPDQTALIGIPLIKDIGPYVLSDINAIMNFKCIDYTASSASNVQVSFYF